MGVEQHPTEDSWREPPVMTRFETSQAVSLAVEEERDDGGNLTRPAHVILRFSTNVDSPIVVPGQGVAGVVKIPTQGFETTIAPVEAIDLLEEALEDARKAAASMQEQPLDLSSLEAKGFLAASPGDVPAVAEAVAQPIIPERHRR